VVLLSSEYKTGYLIKVFLPVPIEDRENARDFADQMCINATNATALEFDIEWVEPKKEILNAAKSRRV
jgi:hypothetical protein